MELRKQAQGIAAKQLPEARRDNRDVAGELRHAKRDLEASRNKHTDVIAKLTDRNAQYIKLNAPH